MSAAVEGILYIPRDFYSSVEICRIDAKAIIPWVVNASWSAWVHTYLVTKYLMSLSRPVHSLPLGLSLEISSS